MRTATHWGLGVLAALAWARTASAQVVVEPGPPQPVAVVEPPPYGFERFSLIYSPEIPFADTSLGEAIDRAGRRSDFENIGFEFSTLSGWFTRYHVQLDFSHAYGWNGIRFEPLGFGWALPLVRAPGFGLEIEPLLSLADGALYFTNDDNGDQNVTFLLGSGAEVQLNMIVGPFYAFLSPIGVEVRWLEATSGAGGATTTGADAYWRFRVGVGVQY